MQNHRMRTVRRSAAALLVTIASAACGVVTASPAAATDSTHAVLRQITAIDMGSFDRVTFDFKNLICIDSCDPPIVNPVPGIASAGYVSRPIFSDASGQPVPVAGNAVIRIAMSNASLFDDGTPPFPYVGPTRIQPDLPNVVDIVLVGDFEGTLSWAIGIRSAQVTVQVTGPRDGGRAIVVDIPHAAAPTPVAIPPSFTG
jgi:hypothetical protein